MRGESDDIVTRYETPTCSEGRMNIEIKDEVMIYVDDDYSGIQLYAYGELVLLSPQEAHALIDALKKAVKEVEE